MSPRPPETRSVLASPRPAPRSPATSRAAMRNRRYPARRSPRRPMPHPPPRHRVDPTHAFRPPVRSTPITPVPIVAGRPTGDPLSPPRTSREPAPASQPSLTLCDHPTGGTPSPFRHRRPGRCSGCAPGTQRRAGRCPRRPSRPVTPGAAPARGGGANRGDLRPPPGFLGNGGRLHGGVHRGVDPLCVAEHRAFTVRLSGNSGDGRRGSRHEFGPIWWSSGPGDGWEPAAAVRDARTGDVEPEDEPERPGGCG